jgi:hypothetical protein
MTDQPTRPRGPGLFLVGNAMFKRTSHPNLPLSHSGVVLLAALAAVSPTASLLLRGAGPAMLLLSIREQTGRRG